MGNCQLKQDFDPEQFAALTKNSFNYQYCIGKGGFGKVWKVERKKSKQPYAMKEMSKARILTKRSLKSVMNERQILTQLQNPFIVNMYYAFQDRENVYLVMDYLSGGDLRYHICKNRRFSEEQTKFFIACLMAGLEYIHNKNIIHRDIKPENLVFDEDGYLRITDFGIARIWRPENSQDTSGTPGYMAPEVMCRQNHNIQVDYFAVGVMAFECMFGRRPYVGKSRQEIRDQILAKQVQIKKNEVPKGWSLEAADFINKMIQRKPLNRLGKNGPAEVKQHPWFKDFPWKDLWDKKVQAPFVPPKQDNFDQKNINEDWKDQEDEEFQQHALSLRRNSIQAQFTGYYYDYQLASMNLSPSFLNQPEIQQMIQQHQLQQQKQSLISSSGVQLSAAISGGNGPMIQYPKSEALSPKNGRIPLQQQYSSTSSQLGHRLSSGKPSTAAGTSHNQSLNDSKHRDSLMSSSNIIDHNSTFYHHQRKASSGMTMMMPTTVSRLTPQQQQPHQQQYLSSHIQKGLVSSGLGHHNHLISTSMHKASNSIAQSSIASDVVSQADLHAAIQFKQKRASSRTGTASTKNSGPGHHVNQTRPWSSSVSSQNHHHHQSSGAAAHQLSGYHYSNNQTPQLNHTSILMRKSTGGPGVHSSQSYHPPTTSHGHSHSMSVQYNNHTGGVLGGAVVSGVSNGHHSNINHLLSNGGLSANSTFHNANSHHFNSSAGGQVQTSQIHHQVSNNIDQNHHSSHHSNSQSQSLHKDVTTTGGGAPHSRIMIRQQVNNFMNNFNQ